jgi:hypothetical protein
MSSNDQTFGQIRHWLALNVSIGDDGQVNIPKTSEVSPYIGPAPLPNYM